jgi:TetR/AcrR family tetracycline transcriptional repressor
VANQVQTRVGSLTRHEGGQHHVGGLTQDVGPVEGGREHRRRRREAFPRTAAAAAALARYISTEQYLWGLRRVLDGIDRAAAPVSR